MTTQKKTRPRFGYTEPLFFAVYLVGISFAMMYVLTRSQLVLWGTIMSAFTIGIAALFYVLRKHKGWSALAAVAISFGCLSLLGTVPFWGADNFMDFMFTSSTFYNPYYAMVSVACFGSIIGFVTCYFGAYSPRPCFILLPAFIPLILSARTAGGIPEWILVLMLTGFVTSAAGIARPLSGADHVIEDKPALRRRRAAIAAVGAGAALLLAVLPRSSKTIYGSKLDEVFTGQTGGYYMGGGQLSNFITNSSVNRGTNSPTGNLLFVLSGTNPGYLSRWSYDIYNGESGWTGLDNSFTGYSDWEREIKYSNAATLVYKLKHGIEEGKLEEYADVFGQIPYSTADGVPVVSEVFSSGKYLQIQVMDGSSTNIVLHPERSYDVTTITGLDTFRTRCGVIFTEANMPANSSYSIYYYADALNEDFVRAMQDTDIPQLLSDAKDEGVITDEEYKALSYVLRFKESYAESVSDSGMTPKIIELAQEITAGLTNDLDKALAIEQWFGEEQFVYDMDFVPAKSEAEYFLFSSRRGICSDYATATTLLARAAGLTARYDEGYFISEEQRAENGLYYITDAQTHAYTSVWIDGFGWYVIDGTSYAIPASDDNSAKIMLTVVLLAAAAAAVLVVVFRKRISGLFFAATFRLRKPEKRIRALYKRTRAIACEVSGMPRDSVTVGEVCSTVAIALSCPAEAKRLQAACDELFYGSGKITADTEQLFRDYSAVLRTKRRLGR